jgi:hypothetical protein
MNTKIMYPVPTPPEPVGVTLELTVDEYKVLRGLQYCKLGGRSDIRAEFDRAFREIDRELGIQPDYRKVPHDMFTVEKLHELFT